MLKMFWEPIILPILNKINARHIVEIGVDYGINSVNILEYCEKKDAALSAIDPYPSFDEQYYKDRLGDRYHFYKELSLNALHNITNYDVAIIDGDHNWYTVYSELKMIEKQSRDKAFPVCFIHDIGWPYGRRDLYYNPDTIPAAYKKPYAQKGILPGQGALAQDGGFNPGLFNSMYENNYQNGVLTAVEDFIRESQIEFRFVKIMGFYGLGILIPSATLDRFELNSLLEKAIVSDEISSIMQNLDYQYANEHSTLLSARHLIGVHERKIEQLNEMLEAKNNDLLGHLELLEARDKELQEFKELLEVRNKELQESKELGEVENKELLQLKELLDSEQAKWRAAEETYKDILDKKEREISASLEALKYSKEEISRVSADLKREERSARALADMCKKKDAQISQLEDLCKRSRQLADKEEQIINKQSGWMESINHSVISLAGSKRWRFIEKNRRLKNKLLFRHNDINELEYIEKIIDEFHAFQDKNNIKRSTLNDTVASNNPLRKKLIGNLPFMALQFFKRPFKVNVSNIKGYFKIKDPKFFNENRYLSLYRDVRDSGMDPFLHYIYYGGFEGRYASDAFDSKYYTDIYPDVAKSRMNPLVHYVFYGMNEGRMPKEPIVNIKPVVQKKKPRPSGIDKQKVSIIMPSWNRAKVIQRAINSVLNQEYTNYELIIVDDGSDDNTEELIYSTYKNEVANGKIKFLKQNHVGVCRARNTGLDSATGELIAFLDSDNAWKDEFLSVMVDGFNSHPECATAYCGIAVHDEVNGREFTRTNKYDRRKLIHQNFIDMNVFMFRRILFDQMGGFNENLRRLVDWEYIIRLTRINPPLFIDKILADYYLSNAFNNITNTENLEINRAKVLKLHQPERIRNGHDTLRLGYVLWDFPALSQTFVHNELRWLKQNGYDVIVYFKVQPDKVAELDFEIDSYCVKDSDELAEYLVQHDRNMLHTHFAYPACTLLTYPAAVKTGTRFTFSAHAVDIFHYENIKRNKIAEICAHPLCEKVFLPGHFHRKYLMEKGVPGAKIMLVKQAAKFELFDPGEVFAYRFGRKRKTITTIARFIEKKGIEDLIRAAALMKGEDVEFKIYGYGPLEKAYRDLMAELNTDNVEICDEIQGYEELKNVYKETDIFVLPCVRAENGDMDGIPTVILEAMSFGVPVISTDVSVIPETVIDGITGFIVPPHDHVALKKVISQVQSMPDDALKGVLLNARKTIEGFSKFEHTINSLLDVWGNKKIDIFMVTYNDDKYNNIEETREIIDRIFEYTTTPFDLTIVDNKSDERFTEFLRDVVRQNMNVRLVELGSNIFCGPASNIALKAAEGEFIFYVCSKEGFLLKAGWERQCINYMRENPDVGIAGHLSASNKYYDGTTYMAQEWFEHVRNKAFAQQNPDRHFKHVQGGLFVLRREAYLKEGGFNNSLVQNAMDVEYSYYLESCGWKLGSLDNIISLTKKTLPNVWAYVDENTIAVHPLVIDDVNKADRIASAEVVRCNICDWEGKSFVVDEQHVRMCPNCSATAFERSLLKYLGETDYIYRGLKCLVFMKNKSLEQRLQKMFNARMEVGSLSEYLKEKRPSYDERYDLIISDEFDMKDAACVLKAAFGHLTAGGTVIVNSGVHSSVEAAGFETKSGTYNSEVLGIYSQNIMECSKK